MDPKNNGFLKGSPFPDLFSGAMSVFGGVDSSFRIPLLMWIKSCIAATRTYQNAFELLTPPKDSVARNIREAFAKEGLPKGERSLMSRV